MHSKFGKSLRSSTKFNTHCIQLERNRHIVTEFRVTNSKFLRTIPKRLTKFWSNENVISVYDLQILHSYI